MEITHPILRIKKKAQPPAYLATTTDIIRILTQCLKVFNNNYVNLLYLFEKEDSTDDLLSRVSCTAYDFMTLACGNTE